MNLRYCLFLMIGMFANTSISSAQVAAPEIDLLRKEAASAATSETPGKEGTSPSVEPGEIPAAAKLDSIPKGNSDEEATASPFEQVANNDSDEPDAAPEALPAHMKRLRTKVLAALSHQMKKPRHTTQHSPWGIMHAMHAFGVETLVRNERNELVNAAGWLCWNKPCRGRTMMYTTSSGDLSLRLGPGYQGHEGQFLALLAQARVQRDFELRVGSRRFTVQDLVEYEKRTCKPRTELTFKLIGLSHYLGVDASWDNQHGTWDIPRLIEEELRQPVIGAACGGTHRLFGHSYALSRARKAGIKIDGTWKKASDYVLRHQQRAIHFQNRDGSFSTEWFEGRGMSSDPERRLQTTGHILEWMVFSLPQVDLQDSRIVRSVDYLATLMLNQRHRDWEIGPRGHAVRALALYDHRVFGGSPGKLDPRLTEFVPTHRAVR